MGSHFDFINLRDFAKKKKKKLSTHELSYQSLKFKQFLLFFLIQKVLM